MMVVMMVIVMVMMMEVMMMMVMMVILVMVMIRKCGEPCSHTGQIPPNRSTLLLHYVEDDGDDNGKIMHNK